MSSLKRKLKRNKIKNSKKDLNSLQKIISSMPENCSSCNAKFNKDKDLDSWMIIQEQKSFQLLCNQCYKENTNDS